MIPIQYEIDKLKKLSMEMLDNVRDQLEKTQEAFLENDSALAEYIIRKELRINSYEMSIDRECENLLALHNPVATDLRLILAILKISLWLERIGDHAYHISDVIINKNEELNFDLDLIKELKIDVLFKENLKMFDYVSVAFETMDTELARRSMKLDKQINKINNKAANILSEKCKENPELTDQAFYLIRIISKLERTGDMLKNVAEEIVFHIESENIKHRKKAKKIKKEFPEEN